MDLDEMPALAMLTTKQTAIALSLCEESVRGLVRSGKLRSMHGIRKILITAEDVRRFLRNRGGTADNQITPPRP
jgi:hypothetical protein